MKAQFVRILFMVALVESLLIFQFLPERSMKTSGPSSAPVKVETEKPHSVWDEPEWWKNPWVI